MADLFDRMDERPKIAITMGDPAGVGPEIILKALNARTVREICRPVVIGDMKALEEAKGPLPRGTQPRLKVITNASEDTGDSVGVIDMKNVDPAELKPGVAGAYAGHASVEYVKKAVLLAMDGMVAAIATAPINKATLKMAGLPWPGHTELLAELTGAKDYGMMLTGGGLSVVLATIHCALRDVPGRITREGVVRSIRLAEGACRRMGVPRPRIAVCGLNPHAGEAGLFGDEEEKFIGPACEEARTAGLDVKGPLPADSLFYKAHKGHFDIVVAMYHDQGLVPLKMLAFGHAVNVTLGLPIVRTSVDHGTAYDIAGKGIANPDSLIEAIKLAAQMAGKR
ncbi:MAG TPA: 4-hydroxythreonine-4-phosphate dehydrogenase PdxA [Nitrospirota bacterium]|nr:4-hydroxythreonine-4-phosphate dehydrogenase PdxA [Nitrospirota bacterium]